MMIHSSRSLTRFFALFFLLGLFALAGAKASAASVPGSVIINEFAVNDDGTTVYDSLGRQSVRGDWIELLVVDGPVDMRGWAISMPVTAVGSAILPNDPALAKAPTGQLVLVILGDSKAANLPSGGTVVSRDNGLQVDPGFDLTSGNGILLFDQNPASGSAIAIDYVGWNDAENAVRGLNFEIPKSPLTEGMVGYFANDADKGYRNDSANEGWTFGSYEGATPGAINDGQIAPTPSKANFLLQAGATFLFLLNLGFIIGLFWIYRMPHRGPMAAKLNDRMKAFLFYECLLIGAFSMLLPFYWMVVTSFKDAETSLEFPPRWTPVRYERFYEDPVTGEDIEVRVLGVQRRQGEKIRAVPADQIEFKKVDQGEFTITREVPNEEAVIMVDPTTLEQRLRVNLDLKNYVQAWFAPEAATRGAVNFGRYFWVSIFTGILSLIGTLITSALAAYAFAKMEFAGKGLFFYIVLLTMMVPGQVLLIPNFLVLGGLGWLDTYSALVVPYLASVFTIFLMRQFFMTIPDDLWDAAQIDGAGRFRFLWQVVAPLSKPVFITAGIFIFLGNWNSLLWPLIVTSSPEMRTLMVGLQNFNQEAGSEFQLLMAASTMAILPIVILFFLLQRFFIQGIARTGLK